MTWSGEMTPLGPADILAHAFKLHPVANLTGLHNCEMLPLTEGEVLVDNTERRERERREVGR